jgi:hypothetical protein
VPSTTLAEITEVGFDEKHDDALAQKLERKKTTTLSLTHVNTEGASQR